ncbi:MAG TPA: AarF/ABC1/UbiB kinase family protein [Acidimicrobiales bacterium]|nr:AarF/ABC1/UbiB kinase family protein [Acidimicrobiales bacterium]
MSSEPDPGSPESPASPASSGKDGSPVKHTGRVRRSAASAQLVGRLGASRVTGRIRTRLTPADRREERAAAIELRTAEQVAESLGDMKGALMKLGQIASFLDEGLPEPYRVALAQLQSDAPPMAPALAAAVIEGELGRPPNQIFREWEPVPLAAASIGQVHRAVTGDGQDVAVKVQYPGVAAAIEADLANTEMLARLLPMMFPSLDAKVLATELRDRLTEELDYVHEAANQRRFCDIYRGHPFIHIPEVIDDLSTPMVLTTELATGARFAEVEQWSAHERDLAGETLFRFVFRGINRLGVFNGDPHPGNYLFRPGGQITFLDFGLVKEFAPEETAVFHRLIGTLVLQGDPEGYRRALESVGLLRPDPSLSTEEVADYFRHFYDLVMVRGRRTVEHEYASETVRRVFNSKSPVAKAVSLPSMFVIVQRINLGLYALLARLGATADWRGIAEELWPMVDGPPTTPLGEAEAEWLSRTR